MAELDLNDLAVFVRVVEHGGFAKAARELRVPTSTVSRTVARLEEAVGARLLQRTTRSVQQTNEGRALFESVAPALASLVHAARSVEAPDPEPRGKLRITAPNDIGTTFVADVVVAFTKKHPHVEIECELTSRVVNLVQEGFDLAVRAGRLVDSALVARRLGDIEAQVFASPAYVADAGSPTTLAELANHPCVLFRPRDGSTTWRLHRGTAGESVDVVVRGPVGCDDFGFVRTALIADAGIGILPRILAQRDVVEGRLVRVLPQYAAMRGGSLHVVYPSSRHVPSRVTAFRDFLVECFARCPTSDVLDAVVAPAPRDAALAGGGRAPLAAKAKGKAKSSNGHAVVARPRKAVVRAPSVRGLR